MCHSINFLTDFKLGFLIKDMVIFFFVKHKEPAEIPVTSQVLLVVGVVSSAAILILFKNFDCVCVCV